jgi:hypothetical protein
MTRTTNARIAGFTFLAYIAVAFPAMVLSGKAEKGQGIDAQLASIATHVSDMRIVIVLSLVSCFAALILAVTLYAITRDEDPDIAMLAMTCRVGEGVIGGASMAATLGLLWLSTTAGSPSPDAAGARTLGAFLLKAEGWSTLTAATFFAVGSTLFSYLLLRGRMVPVPLAWLGVLASVLAVVLLPLQLAGFVGGPITQLMWYPMLVFEVTLALWLLIKGVAPIRSRQQE